ncbi:MAG: ActS/PrrB/RegB family redox-sensitive histidine kinase [Robiginitomaculum sp.]|nr:ActS/PrrB/RegB family redox-sensitive histidine kinase [Robiginitomaculum sp.]
MPYSANKLLKNYGGLRSSTLVLLRWAAIAGQTITILLVHFGFGFTLPLKSSLAVIAISAALNIYLMSASPSNKRLNKNQLFGQLSFDLLQLGALIGLTGGLSNPFLVLFAAPVVVAMTVLRFREAALLFLLVVVMVILLAKYSLPLPLPDDHIWTFGSTLFQFGLTAATLITIAFTGIYVWRISSERNQMAEALSATEAVLATEHRLSALGGLAAATAHELGTPLGTIQLAAKELNRELKNGCFYSSTEERCRVQEDLDLILSQAIRCRQILGKLSQPGVENDPFHAKLSLSALLEETCAPLMSPNISLVWSVKSKNLEPSSKQPTLQRKPEILHSLSAFTENALSFAKSSVEITGLWDDDWIIITICDDGPGFDQNILERLGDPYVTSRRGGNERSQGGLGLGFFISKNLIERTGGEIKCGKSSALGGAMVQIIWPKNVIVAEQYP